MMTPEARATVSDIIDTLRVEEAQWVARVEKEAARPPVLLGQGWAVRAGTLAIRVTHLGGGKAEFRPVVFNADLCGFSLLTRADAERVAATYEGVYKAIHVRDIAKARLAETRDLIAALENHLAAA